MEVPEPIERTNHPVRHRPIVQRQAPCQRLPEVIDLGLESLQPGDLFSSPQPLLRRLRQIEEVLRVSLPRLVLVAKRRELLQTKLPHGLEHRVARLARIESTVRWFNLLEQALIDERTHGVERRES